MMLLIINTISFRISSHYFTEGTCASEALIYFLVDIEKWGHEAGINILPQLIDLSDYNKIMDVFHSGDYEVLQAFADEGKLNPTREFSIHGKSDARNFVYALTNTHRATRNSCHFYLWDMEEKYPARCKILFDPTFATIDGKIEYDIIHQSAEGQQFRHIWSTNILNDWKKRGLLIPNNPK
ncbi:hypothetical protein KFZ76_03830 [Methylovulum psychrotolerans]|uniref:hypothetical protein n=1 Tax=Methylovulum psychrotolerans TaxID=1704499 RepID=UPI001BFF4622|nr:hypothetical protein [Methylovulum psychrotolerans]MBT9096841.1 hypothetical protein [Methylovulum psychrotolerans]